MGKRKPASERIRLKFEEEPVDLGTIVDEVIQENSKALLEYRAGIRSSLDDLISEVMRKSGGRADPRKIRSAIINKL